jgi:hypothetical protein
MFWRTKTTLKDMFSCNVGYSDLNRLIATLSVKLCGNFGVENIIENTFLRNC